MHVPAGDLHLLHDKAEQGLPLLEVKLINHGKDAKGEVMCAVAELVVPGEFTTLHGERSAT
ncbi:MAG: hypothetical protein ACM30G_19730 [Micromonosporaceae bacterium]